MSTATVDFVARGEDPGTWSLVLVEQGPWPEAEIDDQLRRVQERLYDCLDAAIDGQVATQFPDSLGSQIKIRLDGYGLPEEQVLAFFTAFAAQVLQLPDYASALAETKFVSGIGFELALEDLPPAQEPTGQVFYCKQKSASLHMSRMRPNPSVNARPSGGALGPRGRVLHHRPRGPSTPPPVPRYLER